MSARASLLAGCIALMTALVVSPVKAEDAAHQACMEKAGGVTVEMLDCIGAAYERQDKALNVLWNRMLPSLKPDVKALMREAQRQWIVYRDTTCVAEAAVWGKASFAAIAGADCRLRLVTERVKWLDRIIFGDRGQ